VTSSKAPRRTSSVVDDADRRRRQLLDVEDLADRLAVGAHELGRLGALAQHVTHDQALAQSPQRLEQERQAQRDQHDAGRALCAAGRRDLVGGDQADEHHRRDDQRRQHVAGARRSASRTSKSR
jgi:hypothetical protein